MIYLFSNFHCVICGAERLEILPQVKYCVNNLANTPQIVVGFNGETSFAINFYEVINNLVQTENIKCVQVDGNKYVFLFEKKFSSTQCVGFQFKNKKGLLTLGGDGCVGLDGEMLGYFSCQNVEYSHIEINGNFCYFFLKGRRNFVVIIENDKLAYANYYDELNENENEKYFMRRLGDCLNHGEVVHIKDGAFEKYLIYLDEHDLTMKQELCAAVFLDCLISENFNYCNNLLFESLKQESAKTIKNFFPTFNNYYIIEEHTVCLFEKNALAGIYKFDIENNQINNIIALEMG